MNRSFLSMSVILLSAACGDHIADLGPQLVPHGSGGGPVEGALETTCGRDGSQEYVTACTFDSAGNTHYGFDVVPEEPPYGFSLSFKTDVELTSADLVTAGELATIKVYANQTHILDDCGIPESSEENRIDARAIPDGGSGFLVFVDDELPRGSQVAFIFEYVDVLRAHLPLPDYEACPSRNDCPFGHAARLYVGEEPPKMNPGSPTEVRGCPGS